MAVYSPAIGGRVDATMWLPPPAFTPEAIVLLLHGIGDSHWSWSLCGGAHLTLGDLISKGEAPAFALMMPSDGLWGDGSGYMNHHGRDHERWVIDEAPQLATEVAGLSSALPLFVGGLSMGGYAALRLAAVHASRIKAVSAHSPITRLSEFRAFGEHVPRVSDVDGPHDVIEAMRAGKATLPPIRFDCGVDDDLILANRTLHQQLSSEGIDHVYEEKAGRHDWSYWSRHIADSFKWFAQQL
jgi:putative tributyrin esterase